MFPSLNNSLSVKSSEWCVVFDSEDELHSRTATAGDHVQLFPGAEQRCSPTDHFLHPL